MLRLLSTLLLGALCCGVVLGQVTLDNVHDSPHYASALAEIDAQINEHLRMGMSIGEGEGSANNNKGTLPSPSPAPTPTGADFQPEGERFRATSQEVIAAMNSLDMKAGLGEGEAEKPAAHPRPAVAAFASIALETVHRGHSALSYLKNHHIAIQKQAQIDVINYKTWVRVQEDQARQRIQKEVDRVALLTDEVAHLEHVYQDAIAKERSYQVQSNQLITERQLQRTPPMMPVVSSTALSDAQYDEALKKLATYREKALQVIKQTSEGIRHRRILITQGTEWVEHSKRVLKEWAEKQNSIIAEHEAKGQKAVATSEKRILAVEKIIKQATDFHKDYLNALQRLDLESRIKDLEAAKKTHDPAKAEDEYAKTRILTFIKGIDLEIKGVQGKLKTLPGDGKTVSPPSFWGILSQFPHAGIGIPSIGPMGPAGAYGQGFYYHAAYHPTAAMYPGAGSSTAGVPTNGVGAPVSANGPDAIVSPIDDAGMIHATRPNSALSYATGSPTGAAAVGEGEVKALSSEASAIETAAQVAEAPRFRSNDVTGSVRSRHQAPAPPAMPDMPEPPRLDNLM